MNWLKRISFYAIAILLGFSCSLAINQIGISAERQGRLFAGMAFLLGGIHLLGLTVAKWLTDVDPGEGMRAHARQKLQIEIGRRRKQIFARLGTGVTTAILLRVAASFIETENQGTSILWAAIGYASGGIGVLCLVLLILDYKHAFTLTANLKQLDASAQRQLRDLESLGPDNEKANRGQ